MYLVIRSVQRVLLEVQHLQTNHWVKVLRFVFSKNRFLQ